LLVLNYPPKEPVPKTMCGIAGLIHSGRIGSQSTVSSRSGGGAATAARMAWQLRHRGPDGAAYYLDEAALLVHTRLSIIDLKTGTQPIHNEDKTLWLICNGEIFNYVELRAALIQRGHRFHTQSDSEVIVHLYEDYGLDFVRHLNGQFAICLWDTVLKRALLVRDRVGIAPLFYSEQNSGLWFGSEVKAIIAGLQERPSMDLDTFNQLLSFWSPVSPHSMFSGVREIAPGEMLMYREGKAILHRYWDLDFPVQSRPRHKGVESAFGHEFEAISETQAANHVRDLLVDATRIRLRADVPVAAYLSGGLDSSIIATLIRRHSEAPLHTFSLTFAEAGLDESHYQAEIVEQLQTTHSSVRCNNEDIVRHFETAVWHTEMPLVRTAPVPMGLLSRLVNREGMRVVLTGEGADEVFGGYDLFKETKLRCFWAGNPQSQWRPLLIRRLYPYLDLSRGDANAYLATFFGGGVDNAEHPLFSHQPRINTTARINQFVADELQAAMRMRIAPEASLVESLPAAFADWPAFCKAQYLEMKTLMSGYLLGAQGDRMLMQHAVEGRFPFLDHRLIEYANRLHPRLKMRVLKEKYILKKAMSNYLPDSILQRYKQPYRAPMATVFLGEHEPDYLRYLLSPDKINDYGYFDRKKTALLLKKIRAGRAVGYKDNMALVLILSTQSWHQQFVEEYSQRFAPKVLSALLKRVE
jgi:asparagine synthase (glutamine-hydrolysing)